MSNRAYLLLQFKYPPNYIDETRNLSLKKLKNNYIFDYDNSIYNIIYQKHS